MDGLLHSVTNVARKWVGVRMFYEVLYFTENGDGFSTEETDVYVIYEIKNDKSEMRRIYESVNGEAEKFVNPPWSKYVSTGTEKKITYEELFTILL